MRTYRIILSILGLILVLFVSCYGVAAVPQTATPTFAIPVSVTGSSAHVSNVVVCVSSPGTTSGTTVCPSSGFAVGQSGTIPIQAALGAAYTVSVQAGQTAANYCAVISGGSGTLSASAPTAVVSCLPFQFGNYIITGPASVTASACTLAHNWGAAGALNVCPGCGDTIASILADQCAVLKGDCASEGKGATCTGTCGLTVNSMNQFNISVTWAGVCAGGGTFTLKDNSTYTINSPQLVETAASTTTATANIGGSISATDTVENTGQVQAAASVTEYYLSTTAAKTASSYLLTGGRSVPTLAVGASSTGSVTASVPEGVLHGTYYLVACANGNGAVAEANPGSNCKAAATTIVVSGADLVETAVSVPPAGVNIGSSFTVTDTAENIGQVAAGTSATGFYLSTTTGKTAGSYALSGSRAVPALGLNASSNGSTAVTVPAGVANGSYYLLACANVNNTVDESNTGNNCKASASVTVVSTGLNISGTTPNSGTVGTAYAWPLGVNGGDNVYTWSVSVGSLPPGLKLTPYNITGTPTTAGTYNFTIKVTDTSTPQKVGVAAMSITINPIPALTLPPAGPLGPGTVGVIYSAAISAGGGDGKSYTWTVNGTAVPVSGAKVTVADGITVSNTGGATLTVGGTPTAPTATNNPVTLNVSVKDVGTGISVGSVPYTIAVSAALSLPSTLSLPNGVVGQGYSAGIFASGGSLQTYLWTVNGVSVPTNNGTVTLDGITFGPTSGSALPIGGTPNASASPKVTFTVTVVNVACIQCGNTGPTATATYSINVVTPGQMVSGNINLNICGATAPPITVKIGTNPVQTTTTDGNGNFSFANVPSGTYTVTPSITGPSSVFYPASQSVTVGSKSVNLNFSGTLGYTISGAVDYSGSKSGRIYLVLNDTNCGSNNLGTSIAAKGPFTIRGVAPGGYSVQAWMDNLGYGGANGTNPAGSLAGVTLSNANVTGVTVTLKDPAAVTSLPAPALQGGGPIESGAVVGFKPSSVNNGVELASSYKLEWSTSSTFASTVPIAGSKTFNATGGNGANIWILSGLKDGSVYYFRAQGIAGSVSSPWSPIYGPFAIGAPKAANTISGKVTFSGTATGPLYVGFYDQNTGNIYSATVRDPVSPQAYTVEVPNGSNYFFFGIIDQNNDGMVDAGDISNTNGNGPGAVAISSNLTVNLTLPGGNSSLTVNTQHNRQTNSNGTSDNYNVGLQLNAQTKLPVLVELISGPNVVTPTDIGLCTDCGSPEFDYWPNLGSVSPKVGDAYTLQVTYGDGTSENVTGKVGAVLNAFATAMVPTGSGISTTPTFTWTDPASASSYVYQFKLWDSNNSTIWQIPTQQASWNGLPSSITKVVWGTDPTASHDLPSVSALTDGANYGWSIQAQDSNGNTAQMQVGFMPGTLQPLTLPGTNPLGPATDGQSYTGTIVAGGGVPFYYFKVNGSMVNTASPVTLGYGLSASNNGNNTLTISGIPSGTGQLQISVSVQDNSGNGPTAGPVTYSINVSAAGVTTLQVMQTANPTGVVGTAYSFGPVVVASGGTPPYTYAVKSGEVVPGLSLTGAKLSGTPTATSAPPYANFTVSVKDSGTPQQSGSALVAMNIFPAGNLLITTKSLPSGTEGATYSQTVAATGGKSPYTWSILSGTLPDGLSLSGNTISGTPTGACCASNEFTLKATDSSTSQEWAQAVLSIAINSTGGGGGGGSLSFGLTQNDVPGALAGAPYEMNLEVGGGTPPYTFSTHSGALPPGLGYSDGALQGTPTATDTGSYIFTVEVTDSASPKASTAISPSLTVVVGSAPIHEHDAWLKGTYACLSKGFFDNSGSPLPWTSVASLPLTGTGTFAGGVFDMNAVSSGLSSGTLTGTVNIGADNTGVMSISSTNSGSSKVNTVMYAVTLNSLATAPATEFHVVEIDDVGSSPSGQHIMADCYLTTPAAIATSTIIGNTAFELSGSNGAGSVPKAALGQFIASGGKVTGGEVDMAKGYLGMTNASITGGSYSTPDAHGRYNLSLTTANSGSGNFVVYIVDSGSGLILETDDVQSGYVRKQMGTLSNASLNGPFVVYYHAHSFDQTTGDVNGYWSSLMQGTGNGKTGITINQSYNDEVYPVNSKGTLNTGKEKGAMPMTIASNGRAVLTPDTSNTAKAVYFYLWGTDSGFVMDSSSELGVGWLVPQTLTSFTDAAVAGKYEMGQMFALSADMHSNIGEIAVSSSGGVTGTSESGGAGVFSWESAIPSALTYAWDTSAPGTGTFIVSQSGSPQLECVAITAAKFVCIEGTSSEATVSTMQQ